MSVPMIDLRVQYQRIKDKIDAAVAEVFATQGFVGGPKVDALEQAVNTYLSGGHAVAVASGTDALLLALKAGGIKPGDEVITTPFSFFATAGTIANAGATPVFADIDPVTFNIDPEQVAACVTPRTRAIMPVHLYGQCADMDALREIAGKHHLAIIEDAAQSFGARYKGCMAGLSGDLAAVSFYPTKNLGGAGDGGMVLAADADVAANLRLLRSHGAGSTYYHTIVGTNSRLDAIQAAVLLVKLEYLDKWNEERRRNAAYYTANLKDLPGVVCPVEMQGNYHIYHQYVVRVPRRDAACEYFHNKRVGCAVFYPVPLHRQECFRHYGYAENALPEASRACREVLALPIYAELTRDQQDLVIETLRAHVEKNC